MVSALPRPASHSLALVLAAVLVTLLLAGSVNSLPGFSDHTGPTELDVVGFERTGSGCVEDPEWPVEGSSSGVGSGYVRSGGIVTADTDADLSVWVERSSPAGADLSTFRIHVESRHEGSVGADCGNASVVGYRLELEPGGGSPPGLLPDDHGTRVLYLENGDPAGCSAGYTGGLEGSCDPFFEEPRRTWANATARPGGMLDRSSRATASAPTPTRAARRPPRAPRSGTT